MGVVLNASLGLYDATTATSRYLGYSFGPKANSQLQLMAKKKAYYADHQKSAAFIRARYSLKCAKLKLKDIEKASTETARGLNDDHHY